jgi:hypothetical protein
MDAGCDGPDFGPWPASAICHSAGCASALSAGARRSAREGYACAPVKAFALHEGAFSVKRETKQRSGLPLFDRCLLCTAWRVACRRREVYGAAREAQPTRENQLECERVDGDEAINECVVARAQAGVVAEPEREDCGGLAADEYWRQYLLASGGGVTGRPRCVRRDFDTARGGIGRAWSSADAGALGEASPPRTPGGPEFVLVPRPLAPAAGART